MKPPLAICRTLACLSTIALLPLTGHSDEPDSTLGDGLKTLQVIQIDRVAGNIIFLPTRLAASDLAGRGTAFEAHSTENGQAVVSGRLTFLPVKDELATLQTRADRLADTPMRLVKLTPKRFAVWLQAENKLSSVRPWAAGTLDKVLVDAKVKDQLEGTTSDATVFVVVTWDQELPPLKAKFSIDWKYLKKVIEQELQVQGAVTQHSLETLAERAIADGKVQIDGDSDAHSDAATRRFRQHIRYVLVSQIAQTLLASPQPVPARLVQLTGEPGQGRGDPARASICYKSMKNVQLGSQATTIDLSSSRSIERYAVVHQRVTIQH